MPYSKAVIYKIYSIDEPDKFYVGSTANSIWRRFYYHKKYTKTRKSFFYTEVNRLGWDKFKIEVIENFPCNNRQELFAEEERIRSETNAYYNTRRAYLTEEQRKELIKECCKIYQDNHRAEIAEQHAKYYAEHKDYRYNHKEEIKEWNKTYRDNHKEEIKERQKNYYKEHKKERSEYGKKYRENKKRKSQSF